MDMDDSSQSLSKPEGERGASVDAPVASEPDAGAAEVEAKLFFLLQASARGEAVFGRTAHSRLVEWIRNSPAETIAEILTYLVCRPESQVSSNAQTVGDTLLPLIVRECPGQNEEITDCLLSTLQFQSQATQIRVGYLLKESMRMCPTSRSKIIREFFRAPDLDCAGRTLPALVSLLHEASEEFAQEAFDEILQLSNNSLPSCRATAAMHLHLLANVCPKRKEDVIQALFRGCNDPSARVRSVMITTLTEIVVRFPDKSSEITQKILDLCTDEHGYVSCLAIQSLHTCASICPEKMNAIYSKALLLSSDAVHSISIEAMQLLVKLVEFDPEKADEVASVLLARCHSQVPDVKARALHLVGVLLGTCSRPKSEEIANLLISSCRTDNHHPGVEALKHMRNLMLNCPTRTDEVAEIVLHWSKNQQQEQQAHPQPWVQVTTGKCWETLMMHPVFSTVRANAVCQLGHVAVACPGRVEQILSLVPQACEADGEEVRIAAITQLSLMTQACPYQAEQIADAVLHYCTDDRPVTRAFAVFQLSKLTAVSSETRERLVEALLRACSDKGLDVRRSAIVQLPRAMRSWPNRAGDIFFALLTKLASEDMLGADAAREQLEAALRACPAIAIDVLETLITHRASKAPRLK